MFITIKISSTSSHTIKGEGKNHLRDCMCVVFSPHLCVFVGGWLLEGGRSSIREIYLASMLLKEGQVSSLSFTSAWKYLFGIHVLFIVHKYWILIFNKKSMLYTTPKTADPLTTTRWDLRKVIFCFSSTVRQFNYSFIY